MQFIEFKTLFNNYNIFSKNEIDKLLPKFNKMNLVNWQKKKYIGRIRNGLYFFSDININEALNLFAANKIYSPSYVSMETALNYYGIIPEGVFNTTSITTLKTNEFNTSLGNFTYNTIKRKCFFGYKLVENENVNFKIAEPEKTLLDFFYYKQNITTIEDIYALRLNKEVIESIVNFNKLFDYGEIYESKALLKRVEILKQYINA